MKESILQIGNLLIGLVLFSSLLVWWRITVDPAVRRLLRPIRSRSGRPPEPLSVLTAFLVWICVPIFVLNWLGHTRPPSLHNVLAQNLSLSLVLVILWSLAFLAPVLAGKGRHRLSEFGIGLRGLPRDIGYGLVGFLAAVLPVYLVRVATVFLHFPAKPHSLLKFLALDDRGVVLFGIGVSLVVLAPLVEEFLFRVTLQGWLETVLPPGLAIGVTAAVFALVHPFTDSLALFPLALILGCLYHVRHSYPAVVTLHATFNAANLLLFLTSSRG